VEAALPQVHQSPATSAHDDKAQRRTLMTEATTEIIAHEGLRALTHRAVDAHLNLPTGSTSYYFRTRDELLAGALEYLRERSVADFENAYLEAPRTVEEGMDIEHVATRIAQYLDIQLSTRPHHIKARVALALELSEREEFRGTISDALFAQSRALELFEALGSTEPAKLASGFTALIEGLAFRSLLAGNSSLVPGSRRVDVFHEAIASYLLGVGDPEPLD
jgi:AcrR family transcriptional regulator